MAYCPKCGASLPDNARFCGICGAQMAAPANDPGRQYTQPRQPAYDGSRQYSQPQQPVYQNRQPAYDNRQYQQSRQQAYDNRQYQQNYGYTRQPACNSNDYGWTRPEPGKKPVRHVGFLRFLSLLFAIGLIAAAAAFGCRLYLNKTFHDDMLESVTNDYGEAIDELKEEYKAGKVSEEQYQRYLKMYEDGMKKSTDSMEESLSKYESDLQNVVAAAIREDADGLKTAAKSAAIHIMKTQDGDMSSLTGTQQTVAEFYNEKKSDIDLFLTNWLNGLDNQAILKPLHKIAGIGGKNFSYRWLMLQVGARWLLIAIAGGGLAALCFLLWLICRGPSAGAGRSWFVPMLFIALLLSAALVAASWFAIKPVSYRELEDVYNEQLKSETETAEWAAIGDELKKTALDGVIREFDTVKTILPVFQSIPGELVTPELIETFLNTSGSIMNT